MENEVRELLEEAIERDLENLKNFEGDEKEREKLVKEIQILSGSLNEAYKTEADQINKEQQLEIDKEKAKVEKKRFWAQRALELVPTAVYLIVATKVLKVEDTSMVTTKVFNFLPKPKSKI